MAHDHGHHHDELGHSQPTAVYWKVFAALVALTVITVLSAQGLKAAGTPIQLNATVAFSIAAVKAILVMLFFMHLKFENRETWLYVAFPIVLVIIMIAGVMIDNPLRKPGECMIMAEGCVVDHPANVQKKSASTVEGHGAAKSHGAHH